MKGRSARKNGGAAEGSEKDFGSPRADYKAEENAKPQRYNNAPKIQDAAEEKKRGGRAKRKSGGGVKHHETGKHMGHAKHIGPVQGSIAKSAGRSVRASGGRAGSNFSPMSSAAAGSSPRGHKTEDVS